MTQHAGNAGTGGADKRAAFHPPPRERDERRPDAGRRPAMRSPSAYFAESTRVLAAEYDSAWRTARPDAGQGRPPPGPPHPAAITPVSQAAAESTDAPAGAQENVTGLFEFFCRGGFLRPSLPYPFVLR